MHVCKLSMLLGGKKVKAVCRIEIDHIRILGIGLELACNRG